LKKIFVDTNLFIRYLIDDIPSQIDKVEYLLDLAEKGEVRLVTGPPVFFEMAWTLKSFYKMNRKRIYECLSSILSDAYIAISSKKVGAESIATFNTKHFRNLDVKIYSFK
jgi:predicted nucleic acid-binding protein